MKNVIRFNRLTASKKCPTHIILEPNTGIIYSSATLGFINWFNHEELKYNYSDEPISITFEDNVSYSIFSSGEVVEYSKVINLGPNQNYPVLIKIEFKLTPEIVHTSEIYRNYSVGDLGLFKEVSKTIDFNLSRFYREITNKVKIEVAKTILMKSINRVLKNYKVVSPTVEWIEFEDN